ncbi:MULTISPECIES: ribbon-helix-helix domain-containing protein [Rhizobium/Agrobacterium group]|uniref:Ribbon-helix-helix domain-containing protein n=1 Tax=Agrobacterium vitis TaxID=373 RepID=A0AAE2RFD0_AGRVI|nr:MULTISPECIES: ribbon-helix-helix domain-containing protein [Rhizobium/Agrobacterium group]MBF2715635.1 ribbon-helix-helix domain-containing protein [Agrobacterium vitis]NSX96592.1 aryl-sulfate sulfotransferase [Agrobacterium vitis]NSZ27731.1 aryl-sulfate sulfotransferase [Agrobacterium vitis]OHZ36202.1 aryl-sulfate sulfotransferase [Agrobacterium vitis]UJL79256.1 ribbon-helix-helix domain-containing protein [Agrobacterium vitis]
MIRKHSISLHGHRTSFSLEDAFWQEIRAIAESRNVAIAALIADIDSKRPADCNLSSALRLYVLEWLKQSGSDSH